MQSAYLAVKLRYNMALILDQADAAALMDILTRNQLMMEETDKKWRASDERITLEMVRADAIEFPTPPLSDAVAMALRK